MLIRGFVLFFFIFFHTIVRSDDEIRSIQWKIKLQCFLDGDESELFSFVHIPMIFPYASDGGMIMCDNRKIS